MYLEDKGDAGYIGSELLEFENKSPETRGKCFTVEKAVNEGYFELVQALKIYDVKEEDFIGYLLNNFFKVITQLPDERKNAEESAHKLRHTLGLLTSIYLSKTTSTSEEQIQEFDQLAAISRLTKKRKKISKNQETTIKRSSETKRYRPRILIVDDNILISRSIREMTKSTYEVFEATDIIKGAEIAKEKQPDIILIDVSLANFDSLSGSETLSILENYIKLSFSQIVIMTSSGDLDFFKRIKIEQLHYINKPIDTKELITKIEYYIEKKES